MLSNLPIIRVLLVDDDEDDYLITRGLLSEIKRQRIELSWVNTYDDALATMERAEHDLYLLDYRLGDRDGIELLEEAIKSGSHAPIILLTGQGDEEVDYQAMKTGAADYLVKDQLDASSLERSIRYAVERSRTLEALRLSEERYTTAVHAGNVGVWDFDLQTNETYFSPNLKAMLGYDDEEIENSYEGLLKHVHPEDQDMAMAKINDYLDGGLTEYEIEQRMLHKDGTTRWFLSRGRTICDFNNRPVRLLGTHTDITTLKEIQTEIVKAKQAAEGANRAKSVFLANMSHELRTPLTVILGFSETLQGDEKAQSDPEFLTGLRRIESAATHLLGVINNVLDLSKVEAGKLELYLETFDVSMLISDVLLTTQPLVDKRGNKLKVDYGNNVGIMYADMTRMRQVLINLLNNAAKFTEDGVITLGVHSEIIADVEWLNFSISDTGIGMTEEQVEVIFEEFRQADNSISSKYGGTGLGLSISRRICNLMGGEIWIESEYGKGSTFTVHIPAFVTA